MKRWIRKLNAREIILFALTGVAAVSAVGVRSFILPAYDEGSALRSKVRLQAAEYARLEANLQVKDSVNKQFERLGEKVSQSASDQMTLSDFLRELETLARHPSLTLINMKPLPVKNEVTHKIYRVKLSVAGKLQEILQFITDVTNGPDVTGLESFALRGVQGLNMVECNLSLWMVRLLPEKAAGEKESKPISTTAEVDDDR
jgi:Tfp pilus assembly protein PilO